MENKNLSAEMAAAAAEAARVVNGVPEGTLNAPTPWSISVQPSFRNFIRCACRVLASTGQGVGGTLLTARVDFATQPATAFTTIGQPRAAPQPNRHQKKDQRRRETKLRRQEFAQEAQGEMTGPGTGKLEDEGLPVMLGLP